ncbi:MAG: Trp biosynthesis-associated membrane protein [Cryobacterium sp.]
MTSDASNPQPAGAAVSRAKRLRLALIVSVLLSSTFALLAWTQVWGTVDVAVSTSVPQRLDVEGATAAPAVTALALAGFALAGALTIAGPVIRVILGVLEVLLGASVFLAAVLAVSDPAQASASAVTAATGIAGRESIVNVVVGTTTTFWPYLALGAAVWMSATGIAIVATATRWPGPTKKYQAVRFAPATGPSEPMPRVVPGTAGTRTTQPAGDPVVDWDDLSRGQDPTSEGR